MKFLFMSEKTALSEAKITAICGWSKQCALRSSFHKCRQIKIPGFRVTVFYFKKFNRESTYCVIIMIQISSLLGPMLNSIIIDRLHSNIGAVYLKPVVVNIMKFVRTFTTPFMLRIFNIRPSVSSENSNTRVIMTIWRKCKPAHLICLRCFMFIPFHFQNRIIIISEIPGQNRIIIKKGNIDSILWITSPKRRVGCLISKRSKCQNQNYCKNSHQKYKILNNWNHTNKQIHKPQLKVNVFNINVRTRLNGQLWQQQSIIYQYIVSMVLYTLKFQIIKQAIIKTLKFQGNRQRT